MNTLRDAAAASVLALLASAGAAFAADPDQAVATQPSSTVVAPLTVTAERRVVNLQTTPLAAAVLTGDQLQQQAVYNVDQLQFVTPSLTVTNYGLGEDFNIRGIGKTETNVQTPSGVVVYRDGVAVFAGFFTAEPYYDIANVEVLRGPQGTFAGQNASGGAIFITEKDPNFGGVHGTGEAQYGAYKNARLRGAVNIPLSDTLAVRLAADGEREDSYYRFTTPQDGHPGERRELSARFSVLWRPTEAFKVLFKNDFNYLSIGALLSSPLPIPSAPPYPTYADNSSLFVNGSNAHNISRYAFNRSVLNVSYTFGSGIILRSISGFQIGRVQSSYDIDGTAAQSNYFSVIAKERIWSEEVNLISPDTGRIKWVVGAFYQNDRVHIPFGRDGFDIATPPLEILLDYTTPKTTEAAFGQVTVDLSDAFQVVAGARYTHSKFELHDRTALLLFGLPGANFGLPDEFVNTSQGDNRVTGKVALNWKLDDNNFLYAFVATGHKPGGINTTPVPFGPNSTPVAPFQPENLTDYEVGWKPTFLDGHVRGQFGAYYTRYKGYQLTYGTSVGGVGAPGQQVIRNVAGTTVIYGLEGQLQAVIDDWSFNATGDYLHTRLGSTPGDCPGTPATVSLSCISGPLGVENIGGREQPYAPHWSFSLGGQYTIHLGGGSTLTPRVDYAYLSSQWASVFNGTALGAYAYHLRPVNTLNAQITWAMSDFRISLFGTNLTNGRYFYETPRTSSAGFGQLRYASPPREYGVRVSKAF